PLALELARWGVLEAAQLAWLDPPPQGHLAGARSLLGLLGALDPLGRLTPLGGQMAALPGHPRLARLLLAAQAEKVPGLGADLAALIGERDLAGSSISGHASPSDLLDRLELLRRRGFESAARAARYWRQKLAVHGGEAPPDAGIVGRLLALAFPDRIGREREPGSGRYVFSGGFGGRLSPRSAVKGGEWIVAVEVAGKPGAEGEIRLASVLARETVEELFGAALDWRREVDWDERAGRVIAREVRRLGALPLQERPVKASAADVAPALLAVLRRKGLELLDWSPAARQLRARAQLVAAHRPGWPDLSDAGLLATLETWLAPHLAGVTGLAGLRKLDLCSALQNLLGWQRQQELARLAPERLEVPSGSNIRLDYQAEDGPVLACKLQELFGLAETPRVAGGAVSVLIHLLSPAGRPLAVTRDLRSFWDGVYPEVKKEMKGRYPKHPWPDDPWNAVATKRTKNRM
ncbi:ATP-dependent helicase C-terminal domain-containing protein, partial [Trichloromonas sp.]|uniref:ATP-dependent helicase C-terminal domain-containing protein n=1 Tax=Trichloromonas sp. TaxID=3069249 RepID=UPI003D81A467